MIYPVDSAIQLFNNWGQLNKSESGLTYQSLNGTEPKWSKYVKTVFYCKRLARRPSSNQHKPAAPLNFCREKEFPVREEPVTYNETDPLLGDKEKEQRRRKKRKKPSLLKALVKMFALNFLSAIMFKIIQDCLIFVQPQLLR